MFKEELAKLVKDDRKLTLEILNNDLVETTSKIKEAKKVSEIYYYAQKFISIENQILKLEEEENDSNTTTQQSK